MGSATTYDDVSEFLQELGFEPLPPAERRVLEYGISSLIGVGIRAPKERESRIFGFFQGMTLARTHDAVVWVHRSRQINLSGLNFCDLCDTAAHIERLHLNSIVAAYEEKQHATVN